MRERTQRNGGGDQGSSPTTGPDNHTVKWDFLGSQQNNLKKWNDEINDYWEMLLGREELPVQNGVMSLMESSTAMYSRAAEITAHIQALEADGHVIKNSKTYKFRTGPLRTFMEACSKAIDLGSRRVTALQLEYEMVKEGL